MFIILTLAVSIAIAGAAGPPGPKGTPSRLSAYEGKLFAGTQGPEFKEYDLALRKHLVKRIHKRFGIELDPKTYSGFDLLEIEALIRLKRSDEPLDFFLKLFPKSP